MINLFLHGIIDALIIALLGIQVLDVHSTILALRNPWVIEVGDERIGLWNISGWAQKHLGDAWPVIKAPFLFFVPVCWTPIETIVEVPMIMLLVLVCAYFFMITRDNHRNAYAPPPVGWKP
mgnify:CR=1 FL=1